MTNFDSGLLFWATLYNFYVLVVIGTLQIYCDDVEEADNYYYNI